MAYRHGLKLLQDSIHGGVLFGYAFRPFFLLVGLYAVLGVLAWGLFLGGLTGWPEAMPAPVRHGHEMVFGFAGGAIGGFLLTAVATWTRRSPVAGWPLMGLCGAWLTARVSAFLPGGFGLVLWGCTSLLFWAGLLALMGREIIAARLARHYLALALLLAFLLAEIGFFLSAPQEVKAMETSLRGGVFLVWGMISLIGGRIIPAFTQNWLHLNRPEITVRLPAFDRFDLAAVGVGLAFGIGFVGWPEARVTGGLGVIAALLQVLRLARWQGWLAWREPLLWVLHVGYAWIPIAFGLLGTSSLLEQRGLWDGGLHALTYGAVGTLIIGVAARVALGHTGRPLHAFPAMAAAFGLMTVGAVCRIAAPLGSGWMMLSVALWIGAYLLFLIQYVPILLAPRVASPDSRT